jgi:hypothetical protein
MKKIILALFIGLCAIGRAQKMNTPLANAVYVSPTFPYGVATQPQPIYATGGNTGTYVTYNYTEYGKLTYDTISIITNSTFTKIVFDSMPSANITLMADTVGDTVFNGNYPNGKSKTWVNKNPFRQNHQGDELQVVINGSKKTHYHVTFGANFDVGITRQDTATGFVHDTLQVKRLGYVMIDFMYSFQKNAWEPNYYMINKN